MSMIFGMAHALLVIGVYVLIGLLTGNQPTLAGMGVALGFCCFIEIYRIRSARRDATP